MEIKRGKIMLVDDEGEHLVRGTSILTPRYEVVSLSSAETMFEALEADRPDLILMDIGMPGMGGLNALAKLKSGVRYIDIPVILLSAGLEEEEGLAGRDQGAADCIAKPLSAPRLLKRVEAQLTIAAQQVRLREQQEELKNFNSHLQDMIKKTADQIYNLQNAMLSTVAELVEFRDNVTGGHITRTQRYLSLLVTKLISRGIYLDAISPWDLNFLFPSAQLHDVGKIAISDTILNKPSRLTAEEFEVMKKHTVFGVEAIERIERKTTKHDFLSYAKVFAGTHHEKWDGSGYPYGLKGLEIPLQGRLMAIADVYDALIAVRPYKLPLPIGEAERIIFEGAEGHFDPQLVEVFSMVAPDFAKVAEQFRESP
jgi:putative two-component system response regulator